MMIINKIINIMRIPVIHSNQMGRLLTLTYLYQFLVYVTVPVLLFAPSAQATPSDSIPVSLSENSSNDRVIVYRVEIRDEIGPVSARKLGKALDAAIESGATLVILELNTYGGMLESADTMRTRLLNLPVPVIAFIDNNAASAGALISIACNRIYMRSGASIGAATVVDMEAKPLPDKYQSYMRSMMRATAEKRNRDPRIAEAMVDPRTFIPGVNDSGKVLTFTTQEAIRNGYCEGQAESVSDILALEGIGEHQMLTYHQTFLEKLISFFIHPAVSGILLLLMLGGIYFELQSPGIGFPLLVAVLAAIGYFAPLYLEGLAANWEILLAFAGFVLLAVEIFILPGFGIAGVSGIILLITAFTFSMLGNDGFNFEGVSRKAVVEALSVVVIAMASTVVLGVMLGKSLLRSNRFGKMVLTDTMVAAEGYVSSDSGLASLAGRTGITATMLRPAGKIQVGDDFYPANAEFGFIEQGKAVIVTRFDGITLWVKEAGNG